MKLLFLEGLTAFLYGSILGSFLNVCIYRLPLRMSLWKKRSHCPVCKTKVAFYDNLPILSYLLLKGRCRNCNEVISSRYPIVEILTAITVTGLFFKYDLSVELFYYGIFCCCMIILIFIDFDHRILPDRITIPYIFVGFGASFFISDLSWTDSLKGALAGPGLLLFVLTGYYLIKGEHGMGMGDVKMAGLIGAFLGLRLTLFCLIVGSLIGTVVGIICITCFKKGWSFALPFGSFLGMGAIISLFFGDIFIDWYWGLFY